MTRLLGKYPVRGYTTAMTIERRDLQHALGADCECHASTPVFVKVVGENYIVWVEAEGVANPKSTEAPWLNDALVIEAKPLDVPANIRARLPRSDASRGEGDSDSANIPQDLQDPAESHFGITGVIETDGHPGPHNELITP